MYRTVVFNHVGRNDAPASISLPRWEDFDNREDAEHSALLTQNAYIDAGWQLFTSNNFLVNGLVGESYRAIEFHVIEVNR